MPNVLLITSALPARLCWRESAAGQGDPSGASATLTNRASSAHRIGHFFKRLVMCSPAVCVLTFSLGLGALAQDLDLAKGIYVNAEAPCDDYPSIAALTFDGQSFGYKRVQCQMNSSTRSGDAYEVKCVEANDPSTREIRKWSFKRLTQASFSIDGVSYRMCEARR